MRHFIIGAVAAAIAFYGLTRFLPDLFTFSGQTQGLIVLGVIFGVVNGLIGPVVKILSLPLSLLTMGLAGVLVNAGLLVVVALIANATGFPLALGGLPARSHRRHARCRRDRVDGHRRRHGGRQHRRPVTDDPAAGRRRGSRPPSSRRPPTGGPALRDAGLRHGPGDARRGGAATCGTRSRTPGCAVLGQGQRRPGGHRGRRGPWPRGQRRLARRVGGGDACRRSRDSDHASKGSARRMPTCGRPSGPRATVVRSAGSPSSRPRRPPSSPRSSGQAGRVAPRRPVPAQPGRRARDASPAWRSAPVAPSSG